MPVENSRVKGLYKLSVEERRSLVAEAANLSDAHVAALAAHGELDETAADRMIENVIGTMSLPVGVATNFVIDGAHITSFRSAWRSPAWSQPHQTWPSVVSATEDSPPTTMHPS